MGIVAVHVRLVLAGPSSNVRYGMAGIRGREGGSISNHVFFFFPVPDSPPQDPSVFIFLRYFPLPPLQSEFPEFLAS